MAEEAGKSALEYVVEILTRHGVEFIIVGGQAAWLFGSPLLTYDIDFCYRRSDENLRRLADALREIQPSLRGAPPDLHFGSTRRRGPSGAITCFAHVSGI
ncbi:MAG TPA: hypothetical protein VGM03_17785 [Phycisphaerae bacterium]